MSANLQPLFELKCLVKSSNIRLSAVSPANDRQLIALVLGSRDVVLYHALRELEEPQVRWIPWFEDSNKEVQCLAFEPLSGAWLLLACYDGTLQIVPVFSLFGQRNPVESSCNDWSRDDVTSVSFIVASNLPAVELCPTAVTWWIRHTPDVDRHSRDVAIVGTKCGHVIFVSLNNGAVVGSTTFDGAISSLSVCKSEDSSEGPTVILLVTGLNQQQWKVILEHRESGNFWPFTGDIKSSESSLSSSVSGYVSDDLHGRLSLPSFPSARTRLQGLKQLSVEKLTSLRQKLSDSRNRGLAGGSSIRRKGSSSSEDSLSRYRLSSDSLDHNRPFGSVTGSPRVLSMTNIQLTAQHFHKRMYFTGYYAPANIVTVYCAGVELNPVSVHRLCVSCSSLVLCDHLFYIKSPNGKKLSLVSTRLSECHVNSEKHIFSSEATPDSLLHEFVMTEPEIILALHKIPAIPCRGSSDKAQDTHKSPHRSKRSSKSSCSHTEANCKELCVAVTNSGVYVVSIRPVHEEVMACIRDAGRLEEGERLSRIFGLDLQKLLEIAADQQLDARMLESGIALYRLSKCRPLKSVLKLAAAGYTVELLPHVLALLNMVELLPSEHMHLSNLSVLSYTEKILRAKQHEQIGLINRFKEFLSDNVQYDEALAVNIVAQSGLCRVLTHLANDRGLHPLVADILARLLTHFTDPSHRIDLELADGFWECLSDRLLCESYLVSADVARTHVDFIKRKLVSLDLNILEKLAAAYDPSRPVLRPIIRRYLQEKSSGNGFSNIDAHQSPDGVFPFSDWLSVYLFACIYLVQRRPFSCPPAFLLTENLGSTKVISERPPVPETNPMQEMPVCSAPTLSAGFAHVGLVRNKQLIAWGQSTYGCLGGGPNLSKTATPTSVGLFPQLSVTVTGVACGRFHTLALTDNGVYSWGSSKYGQLGVGKVMQSSYPRLIEGLANQRIVSVECGQYHSMALTVDGKLWTWGWGVHGQLGHGSVEDHHYPTIVENLTNEVCVSCSGGHAHTLVLTSAGRVWAFGSSVFGQLGTGSNVKSSRPVQVYGLPEKIVMIATAYFHNLGLAASNRLYTWGSSPQVLRLQAQAQKRARFRAQQMLTQDGPPETAPPNCADCRAGQAAATPPTSLNLDTEEDDDSEGKGSKSHFKMVPTSRFVTLNSEMVVSPSTEMKALPTGRNINEIPEGSAYSMENGPVSGNSSGTLAGLDDGLAHLSPTLVDTSHVEGRITMISCGCHHSALLTDNGRVHTWGRNLDGQLGNGARTKEALHPTHISIGGPVETELQHVVCGGEFTLGMEASGKVWAWGSNQCGQLGRAPIEDSTKAGIVMLRTSKRVIKLPHGSLNTADSPKELTGLPPLQLYDRVETSFEPVPMELTPLSTFESPPHGLRTLHYTLEHFNGCYNSDEILSKCIEQEDWLTASTLAALNSQFDQALRYRLRAAAVISGSNDSSKSTPLLPMPLAGTDKNNSDSELNISKLTDVTASALPSSETSSTITTRKDVNADKKTNAIRSMNESNKDCDNALPTTTDESRLDDSFEDLTSTDEHSTSEIHTFAVQGGTEEMSTRSQDTVRTTDTRSMSDDVFDSTRSDTPDTLNSFSCCEDSLRSSDVDQLQPRNRRTTLVQQPSNDSTSTVNEENLSKESTVDYSSAENAYTAVVNNYIKIVESYLKFYSEEPVPVLRDILYQVLDFWLEQSLPVSSLEQFLKEHWDIVHYPLGVLLFGRDPVDKSMDADKILCRLSTDFSLLLCSSMVDHVSDKSKPSAEMIDILAGLSWTDHTVNMDGEPISDPDQDSEVRLNRVLDELCNPQGVQPFIDISFPVNSDDGLTSPAALEVIAFSCGHRYDGSSALHKAALGAAHTLDRNALPNTANALQAMFQQPQLVRHFACPTCILGCVELGMP